MAEGEKPIHPARPIIYLILIMIAMGVVEMAVRNFISDHPSFAAFVKGLGLFLIGQGSFTDAVAATGNDTLVFAVFVLRVLSLLVSAVLVAMIVSTSRKLSKAHKELFKPIQPPQEIFYGVSAEPEKITNPKWQKVLDHVNSPNSADWRLAILEADIMLDEMLDKMGYHGVTIGDKLKSVEASDFSTLQQAWEAHKIRNSIAHEGSDFVLTKPEAERVVRLFQKVFEEFKYI